LDGAIGDLQPAAISNVIMVAVKQFFRLLHDIILFVLSNMKNLLFVPWQAGTNWQAIQ
jgi:hypothetical protein